MEDLMLASNYSTSLTNSSFFSTSLIPSYTDNSFSSTQKESKKTDKASEINTLFMSLVANQSNMLTLLLTLCVLSSWHTYDLRLDSKDNVISPEVYKESQSFLWNKKHYFEIYKLEATNRGREASAYMTVLMHNAVHQEDLKFLNHFFSSLNKNSLTSWSLIALLRSTNVYKNDISLWKDLYLFTRDVVSKEGLNPKREMYGLDRGLSL